MIEITLIYQEREIDLLIPSRITTKRLRELLIGMFQENKLEFPDNAIFSWKDKDFQLGEQDILSDFRISNGDRLELIAEEKQDA